MSIDPMPTRTHPVLACAAGLDRLLTEVASAEPAFLTTAEKQAALVDLSRSAARLEGLRLRVLAAADDIAEQTGARSTSVWLAAQTREHPGTTARAAGLAAALESRWHQTAEAL